LESSDSTEKPLTPSQIEDLRLAGSKMSGAARRSFQAEMTLKYCDSNARLAERLFGWGRVNIEVGLAERRSGIVCIGAQAGYSGTKRWEDKQPEVAGALRQLAEAHAQQDPTFQTCIAYTRLTAQQALEQLRQQGFTQEQLPASSTMSVILNRMGYRLQPVVKAKPQKNYQKPTQFSPTSKQKTTARTTQR
jgi:Rhodopirellula transposase DDE domain